MKKLFSFGIISLFLVSCFLSFLPIPLISAQTSTKVVATDSQRASAARLMRDFTTRSSVPSITVTSPNGGEAWAVGSTQTITWTSSGVTRNVDIHISRDGGSTGSGIIQNTANDGSESWIVTEPATTQARIYVVEHSEEGGNVAGDWSDSNFIISSKLPDLTIDGIWFDRPEPFEEGDVILFGPMVVNQSETEAPLFRVDIYLDGQLYKSQTYSSWKGGVSQCVLCGADPWTATQGSHTVRCVADATNAVVESNEDNNEMSGTFTVSPVSGQPDLSFTKVGFDRSEPFKEGDVIEFGATLVNQGEADALDFRVDVYLDGQLYDSGTGSLGSGHSVNLRADYSWTVTAGSHTVRWVADTTNAVAESNENNNEMSRAFQVLGNNPPNTPSNQSPVNHVIDVSINAGLSWSGGDSDGDTVTYDVYFSISSTLSLISPSQASTSYNPGTLAYNTKYYWKIIAIDSHGASTTGPVWDFTTQMPPNNPPNMPSNPSPLDHAIDVPINADLSWTGGDPDSEDTMTYDVYFGTSSTPPIRETTVSYSATQSSITYNLATLAYNTKYYWKIVARDEHGASTPGPVWYFTTANQKVLGIPNLFWIIVAVGAGSLVGIITGVIRGRATKS